MLPQPFYASVAHTKRLGMMERRVSWDDHHRGSSLPFRQHSVAVMPSKEQREEFYEAFDGRNYSFDDNYGKSRSGIVRNEATLAVSF